MNVTRLRALIKLHGNVGVAIAGVCIAAHFIMTDRRARLPLALLVVVVSVGSIISIVQHHPQATEHSWHAIATPKQSQLITLSPELETTATVALKMPVKPLVSESRAVVDLDDHFRDYMWLSSEELMLVRGDHQDKSYTDSLDTWTGTVESVRVATGAHSVLGGLTKQFQQKMGIPGDFRLSPNRTWLEWTCQETPDGWPFPQACRLDGSGQQEFPQDKWSETGWLDDHTWVEISMRHQMNPDISPDDGPVTVTDLQKRVTKMSRGGAQANEIAEKVRARNGGDLFDGLGLEQPVTVALNGAAITATQYEGPETVSESKISLRDIRVLGSHHSGTVLYVVTILEKKSHGRNATGAKCALYVGEAGAAEAHEIGFISCPSNDNDYNNCLDSAYIRWLPDDRQISFVFHKKLYIVNAK